MISIDLRPESLRPGFYVIDDIRHHSDPSSGRGTLRPHVWRPPTDLFETEEAYVVRVEIAGMQDTDFSILLDGRYLSIRGTRTEPPARRAYHLMEIRFGEFSSDVELPGPVAVTEIEAVYVNGLLLVHLPKIRPVKINVEE